MAAPAPVNRFVAMASPGNGRQESLAVEFDAPRAFVSGAQSVLFFARRGEHVMRCYVTQKALVAYFGAPVVAGDLAGESCLRAYDANVDEIRSVARQMIRRNALSGGAVVVTSGDFYRDIVDRHAGRAAGAVDVVPRHG